MTSTTLPRSARRGALLLAALALAMPLRAADAPPAAAPGATPVAIPAAEGEVRRIDKAQSRLTLRHGEIRAIDMPPMTMVFRVRDPKLLEGLAVGDKVRFDAVQADGTYVVTALVKSPPATR